MAFPGVPIDNGGEDLEEALTIGVSEEDVTKCISSTRDVVYSAFEFEPQWPCHGVSLAHMIPRKKTWPLHEISALKKKEKLYLVTAQRIVEEDEQMGRRLVALLSIPGVGPITALTLLAMFRKYPAANRSQIVALVGFDPIQFQSGTSVHGKARISKRGNRELRKRLYQATLSAARYNPSVRALHRRLKEQGRPDKVARIAAARKLLLIAHAIYNSGKMFCDPNEKEG
jgi:hypothetical protein